MLYIYSIKFTFLPFTGKVVIAFMGLIMWMIDQLSKQIIQPVAYIFKYAFLLLVWGLLVVAINSTDQYLYVTYFLSIFSAFFASYFIIKTTSNELNTYDKFLYLIVLTVFVESIITIAIRYIPFLGNILFAIQEFQTKDPTDISWLYVNRFVGLGEAAYFGVVPSCSIGLVSAMAIIVEGKTRYNFFLWFEFVVIAIISFLVARISVVVPIICILWYLYNNSKKKKIGKILSVSAIGVIALIGVFSLLKMYLPDSVFGWAFESFEGGRNESADTVIDQIFGTHFTYKTFLVGDGLYTTDHNTYYGGKDIGYYRQIFYAGIVGLFGVVLFHLKIVKKCRRYLPTKQMREMSLYLLLCYFAAMFKGDKPFFDMFMLLYVYVSYSSSRSALRNRIKL